jgi:hypothetical protein
LPLRPLEPGEAGARVCRIGENRAGACGIAIHRHAEGIKTGEVFFRPKIRHNGDTHLPAVKVGIDIEQVRLEHRLAAAEHGLDTKACDTVVPNWIGIHAHAHGVNTKLWPKHIARQWHIGCGVAKPTSARRAMLHPPAKVPPAAEGGRCVLRCAVRESLAHQARGEGRRGQGRHRINNRDAKTQSGREALQ